MSTLAENAAAVKAAQVAIDAAIVAKGGTTTGGLNNAAAAIAALPSGGADLDEILGWWECTSTKIDFTKIFGPDIIQFSTSFQSYGQVCRDNKKVVEIFAPNISLSPVYSFSNCTALKKITIFNSGNSNLVYTGSTSLEEVNEVGRTTTQVLAATSFLNGIPKTCVVHCTDADIRYIDGAWVVVERS